METDSTGDGFAGGELGDTFESRPIGEYLRRQRILRGMSTEELAELTRIPIRSLERLEGGQFDDQTDGFVRGFVRTVASALGLDAEATVTRMLEEPASGSWERATASRSAKQALAIGVFLVLLGIVSLGVRAAWDVLLGEASTPGSREVVLWHDPVRALAEAAGVQLDAAGEIAPLRSPAQETPLPAGDRPPGEFSDISRR